ncbi:MAG: PGPGW domain-containing protein [Parasphingorhabdus sp.]
MDREARRKRWNYTSGSRFLLSVLGFFLILVSPIIGAIPGPGFIIVFPIGLALVLQNSRWAKKRYVDFKRRFPQYGKWTDWAMRRRRHKDLPDDFELPVFGKVKTKSEQQEL